MEWIKTSDRLPEYDEPIGLCILAVDTYGQPYKHKRAVGYRKHTDKIGDAFYSFSGDFIGYVTDDERVGGSDKIVMWHSMLEVPEFDEGNEEIKA